MKKTKKWILGLLLAGCLTLSLPACGETEKKAGEEPYQASLAVSFSAAGEKEYVNPLIYGQFIEHIETCIYDGIWAEQVLDRKFYYEVGKSGLSPWKTTDESKVVSETSFTLSGGHSAKICAGGDIYQQKMSFEKKEYAGYFHCYTESGCTVKISLAYRDSEVSASVQVPANKEFTKFTYALSCDFSALAQGTYKFEVTKGEGYFDSLSLMPADNYKGMRKDTLETLKELNSPLYRWPGGNFLSGYDWLDGVGNIDERPSRRNLHYMGLESDFASEEAMISSDIIKLNSLGFYGGIEPNDYGLDEFMAMCEYLDAEPLMMVNDGLGSVEDAAAQVEYCNGSASTKYGGMRAANGHTEPYAVRYWGVGNEMFGNWQLGHVPVAEYTVRHNTFVDAMKKVDKDILIVASGENSSSWSDSLFKSCGEKMDFIAEHMYAVQDNTDVFAHLRNMKTNIEGRISNHRALLAKYPACSDVKIAFTEYAYANATNPSRLKDGMGIGEFLNSVIANADVFEMCCYSSTVNATQGCVTTEVGGATMQGAGYVLKLYRDYMQEYAIQSAVKFDPTFQLDVSVTISGDGKALSVAVVNPSEFAVRLNNAAFTKAKGIARHTLTGDYYDSYNSVARDEMYMQEKDNLANVVAPPMSVSVFVIDL